jgi:hypothetical protein
MVNITKDFTVTPDGNMTYHCDKPANVSMIFNPGDSLVRAESVNREWDGGGLPPVGTEAYCLYTNEVHKIVAHDITVYPNIAITSDESGYWGANEHHWYPIKSDKKKAIEDMVKDIRFALDTYQNDKQMAEYMYNLGYRIQESDESD